MSRVIVFTNLSLDGVMQAPGERDEDPRDGFPHGGWATPYAAMQYAGGSMSDAGALLFGRRTYENFYKVWPSRTDNPFTAVLNAMPKYVASTTLSEPLPWINSILLGEDAMTRVAALRRTDGPNLLVFGSGVLVQSLMKHDLVDDFILLIHPVILGTGRRLFPAGGIDATLELAHSTTTPTGVIVATYRPAQLAA
jgi:dihydrofolate reductase